MGPKFFRAVWCGLCLLLAACVPSLDEKLTREGIGADLYTADLAEQTRLQDEYLGLICTQAGMPGCAYQGGSSAGWRAVVTAGMNDIDRRCDSYLAWLDNKKRSREPVLKQINDTSVATQAIMRFSGAGADPISIVGVAFGLLHDSVANYHSRLLLEVESSTVNTIVLTKRNDFRDEIRNKAINTRPDAIYAIRAYLRICLPFTIETDINDLSSLQVRGVSEEQAPSVTSVTEAIPGLPAVTERPGRIDREVVVVRTPAQPIPRREPVSRPGVVIGTPLTKTEEGISRSSGKNIQAALCVPVTGDFGQMGSPTRVAIADFSEAYYASASEDKQAGIDQVIEGTELADFRRAARAFPNCAASGLKSAYEVGVSLDGNGDALRGHQRLMWQRMNAEGIAIPLGLDQESFASGKIDAPTREAIRRLSVKFNLGETDKLTPEFIEKLVP